MNPMMFRNDKYDKGVEENSSSQQFLPYQQVQIFIYGKSYAEKNLQINFEWPETSK